MVNTFLQEIDIIIKSNNPDIQPLDLKVKPLDLVKTVKTQIYDMVGLPPDSYHLFFKHKKLDDNFTVGAFYVESGDILYIVPLTVYNNT